MAAMKPMKQFLKVMKALSDPNRVKILKLLQERPMCVCELWIALEVSQPSASKHLKILEDAGLVDYKKDGFWVYYFLSDGKANPYAACLLGNLKHWLNDDPEVPALIEKASLLNQAELCKR
jgi:ArsR family transcriptional regulator